MIPSNLGVSQKMNEPIRSQVRTKTCCSRIFLSHCIKSDAAAAGNHEIMEYLHSLDENLCKTKVQSRSAISFVSQEGSLETCSLAQPQNQPH